MENAMNTHALLDVNYLINLIDVAGPERAINELKTLHLPENRDIVLSDKEMLLGTSALLNEVAHHESDMSDKMLRIFWNRSRSILSTRGII